MECKIRFSVILGLITIFSALTMSAPPDAVDFFPNIKDNLTKVTFAHAVNNVSFLQEVLEGDIMMIEADISKGTLIGDPTGTVIPIMAHPPAETSDLSLENFLQMIQESNSNASRSVKGVKIDFKSLDVFEMSSDIIKTLYNQVDYPLWLNADIIPGPVHSDGKPVDPNHFLQGCKPYPAVTVSPGWKTKYDDNNNNTKDGFYTESHITDMLNSISDNDINHRVTFPIRAAYGANSLVQIQRLLAKSSSESTITVWSGDSDSVDVEKLRTLIFACGLNRVYIDVPEDLMDRLHLGKSN